MSTGKLKAKEDVTFAHTAGTVPAVRVIALEACEYTFTDWKPADDVYDDEVCELRITFRRDAIIPVPTV